MVVNSRFSQPWLLFAATGGNRQRLNEHAAGNAGRRPDGLVRTLRRRLAGVAFVIGTSA